MLERIKAQERLGQGCGATALAINMHFNILGFLIDIERKFKAPNVTAKLTRVASEHLICGGSGSEPDNAVIALRPRTTATRKDGGFMVNGRKIFGTQSIALDYFFFEATWDDAPHGPTIISVFLNPRETQGLTFKDDWKTMGMRSTESRSTELKDAFVADEDIIMQRPVSTSGRVTKVFAKAPFTIGAPYVGIAAAARDFTVEFMRDRRRYPLAQAAQPSAERLQQSRRDGHAYRGCARRDVQGRGGVDIVHPREWARTAVAARLIAIENSIRVVDLALRAVGGSSYFKRLPLERLHRDVRAGLYHPFDTDESLEFLGKSAFGLPLMDKDDFE